MVSVLVQLESAIVNVLGQIIGVAIDNGGSGYKEPPLLIIC